MRILHVVASTQRRGAEVFAADLVKNLGRAAVEQRVIALRGSTEPIAFDAPVSVLRRNGRRSPLLKIHVGSVRAIRSAILDWSPDVVQAHGGEPLKYAVLAGAGGRSRLVYRKIGAAGLSGRSVRRAAHGALIGRATAVVAVAEAVRLETLEAFGVPEDRVVTIPNAVEADRIESAPGREEARRSIGISAAAPVALFLAALSEEKEPLDVIAVADRVRSLRPDAIILMAGEGPMRSVVEAAILDRGLQGCVRLLGSRTDVSGLLSACDLVMLTSRTEGMPAVVIEAGLAARPVVGYAIGGVPEVVIDGETGFLAPPGDIDGLSRSVLEVFEANGLRERMGASARERCQRLFEMGTVGPQYLELYRRLPGMHAPNAVPGPSGSRNRPGGTIDPWR